MPPLHDARAIWGRYALTRRALETVTIGMTGAGIEVLAVKGVVTATWLYGDPSERPLTDLDIRVRPRDLDRVARVCASKGWRIDRRLWSYRSLVVEVDGIPVDIETSVGPPGMAAVTVDQLLVRASRDPLGFWVPEAHDHAVLLTVNVFKDKIREAFPWAREDVVRVVDAPGFYVATYVRRVREARVEGPAWVVADWMARERKSATWGAVRDLLGGDAPMRRRYTARMRRLFASANPYSIAVRMLTRVASDDPTKWPGALALSVWAELELLRHGRSDDAW